MSSFTQALHVNEWLSPAGLVSLIPSAHWYGESLYVGFVALCAILAIALLFVRAHRPVVERLSTLLWSNLIVGLFLIFFRLQLVPLLGMDLWRTVQEIGFLIWLAVIVRYWKVDYSKGLLAQKVEERRTKYHPKKK